MGGAVIAANAAAAKKRQQNEEEEMVGYTEQDLAQGWEFKFVRSASAAFRKPEAMKAVVQEESRAGWVLVEKFDDGRLRFKRPVSAREKDAQLPADVDPYRSQYGMRETAVALLILGAIFGGLLLVGALIAFLKRGG
jgi:hypothetical protein